MFSSDIISLSLGPTAMLCMPPPLGPLRPLSQLERVRVTTRMALSAARVEFSVVFMMFVGVCLLWLPVVGPDKESLEAKGGLLAMWRRSVRK